MKIQRIPIDMLHVDPANVRRHSARNLEAIRASLARFGQQRPIVVDGNNVVRAGNATLEAARGLGWDAVDVVRTPLAGSEATAFAIADNRTAELAEWDIPSLVEQLKGLEEEDFDLAATGFIGDELAQLMAGQEEDRPGNAVEDPGPQIDRAAELRTKWGVERGQLWEIGGHRLLCGDSTRPEDVARVMGGGKAALCLTDPPYGIGEAYACFDDSRENLVELIAGFMPLVLRHSDVVLLTPGNSNQRLYPEPDWTLCWFVTAGTGLNRWGFTCWQPVLAYGKDPYLAAGLGLRPDALDRQESAENDTGHPCSKPVGVWRWFMDRGSLNRGDIVFDPFAGSGTTLVAAEQSGRRCLGLEIDPGYVAVALERLAGMGLEPRLQGERKVG